MIEAHGKGVFPYVKLYSSQHFPSSAQNGAFRLLNRIPLLCLIQQGKVRVMCLLTQTCRTITLVTSHTYPHFGDQGYGRHCMCDTSRFVVPSIQQYSPSLISNAEKTLARLSNPPVVLPRDVDFGSALAVMAIGGPAFQAHTAGSGSYFGSL